MSKVYDNWERLVRAVLRKEQLRQLFHDHSRSSSISSISSDFSSSFHSSPGLDDIPFDFAGSPRFQQQPEEVPSTNVIPRLVFSPGIIPSFDLKDVLRASGEFLGKGTFGTACTAVLDDGMTVVVKRLKERRIPEPEFIRLMEVIGNIKHENVCTLRAYYSSKHEKMMLYDYYSNGSMSVMLHGKAGVQQASLDWDTRLKIALGAARGIAHIHTRNGGKLVHGNIKASKIFVNSQLYGCVCDIGLAIMIPVPVRRTAQYHAPEVKNTRNVSQASDVYSYGITLLELLTGKSPEETAVDLVKWITLEKSAITKDWIGKVFDTELMQSSSSKQELVKMLKIGMNCVAKTPKKRPKMHEVVLMIENIVSERYSEGAVAVEADNIKFGFDKLLEVHGKESVSDDSTEEKIADRTEPDSKPQGKSLSLECSPSLQINGYGDYEGSDYLHFQNGKVAQPPLIEVRQPSKAPDSTCCNPDFFSVVSDKVRLLSSIPLPESVDFSLFNSPFYSFCDGVLPAPPLTVEHVNECLESVLLVLSMPLDQAVESEALSTIYEAVRTLADGIMVKKAVHTQATHLVEQWASFSLSFKDNMAELAKVEESIAETNQLQSEISKCALEANSKQAIYMTNSNRLDEMKSRGLAIEAEMLRLREELDSLLLERDSLLCAQNTTLEEMKSLKAQGNSLIDKFIPLATKKPKLIQSQLELNDDLKRFREQWAKIGENFIIAKGSQEEDAPDDVSRREAHLPST